MCCLPWVSSVTEWTRMVWYILALLFPLWLFSPSLPWNFDVFLIEVKVRKQFAFLKESKCNLELRYNWPLPCCSLLSCAVDFPCEEEAAARGCVWGLPWPAGQGQGPHHHRDARGVASIHLFPSLCLGISCVYNVTICHKKKFCSPNSLPVSSLPN